MNAEELRHYFYSCSDDAIVTGRIETEDGYLHKS